MRRVDGDGYDARPHICAVADRVRDPEPNEQLAVDRTRLAEERTYAAWVRTALAALASGIGARALLEGLVPDWLARAMGSVLVLFAACCLALALCRQIAARSLPADREVPPIPPALLIGVNGLLLVVTLAALIGIWAN